MTADKSYLQLLRSMLGNDNEKRQLAALQYLFRPPIVRTMGGPETFSGIIRSKSGYALGRHMHTEGRVETSVTSPGRLWVDKHRISGRITHTSGAGL